MNGPGTVIVVGGLAVAVFLYLRSQQQQAAALAAAQGAPGPGLAQKLENTAKKVGAVAADVGSGVKAAVTEVPSRWTHIGTSAAGTVVSPIAGGAAKVVGFVKGLF